MINELEFSVLLLGIITEIFLTIGILFYFFKNRLTKLNKFKENEQKQQLDILLNNSQNLINVIGGINHEIQPWIGTIKNKLIFLQNFVKKLKNEQEREYILSKVNDIALSIQSINFLISNLSKDVKKIKEYTVVNSNLYDSLKSWVSLILYDLQIKNFIHSNIVEVDEKSLSFSCLHSPMLLSQILLNLIKNSIEHNDFMVDDLKIKIYGDPEKGLLIYEDNGRGIPGHLLERVFDAGFSTKILYNIPGVSGFGLSLCREYCHQMNATIKAVESSNGAKFVIQFLKKKNCPKTKSDCPSCEEKQCKQSSPLMEDLKTQKTHEF
ncbi:MAG: sensor histidine kinase [Candidatus Dojkabacteria bacterium]|nr:sensor histidine kinase [Candidatus Dojkabacteria bacterium]